MPSEINTGWLLAAVLWGGIGSGYFIYGWRQRRVPALCGGLALTAITYFISSALWMSLAAIAIMVGTYFWSKKSE